MAGVQIFWCIRIGWYKRLSGLRRSLRRLACWDCGFESFRGHGCLLWVMCVVRCDGPSPRLEESYRLCCVIVHGLDTTWIRGTWPALGCCTKGGGDSEYAKQTNLAFTDKGRIQGMPAAFSSEFPPLLTRNMKTKKYIRTLQLAESHVCSIM